MNGNCEVDTGLACVWVKALERLERTPYCEERLRLNPPVDWQLEGMASWVTLALERDQVFMGRDQESLYASEVLD